MHLILLLSALSAAFGVRYISLNAQPTTRWNRILGLFLFSPLLLLTTAIAILCMGPRGQMVRWWEGWGSYGLAIGFLSLAIILGIRLLIEGRRSLQKIRQCPLVEVSGRTARLIENPTPFVAQIGFWQPELVVSNGLLTSLDNEHLAVVFVHEQGHFYYRDTFWFFWLGWLRRLTTWLPQTEALWQELLILRELRADRWATQTVDNLLLAEALLSVVSAPQIQPEDLCASFSSAVVRNRLEERIDALLDESDWSIEGQSFAGHFKKSWLWLLLVLLPLVVVPFHT
ncbi:M56 family metallopeptidase [Phormidesmis sp. 146-33]